MIYARKNRKNEDFVILDPKIGQIKHFSWKTSQNFYSCIKNLTHLGSVKVINQKTHQQVKIFPPCGKKWGQIY